MATKSKLELAVDAGKWEDGLKKAQSAMKNFENSIGGLEKATSSEKEKMAQFVQILGNTKSTAATASQQVKEYRSTIERLQVISTKLNDEQKKLAEDAMAKLTQRMHEAKAQADELNKSMNETASVSEKTGSDIDNLSGKFGLSAKQIVGWGAALGVGKLALDGLKAAVVGNIETAMNFEQSISKLSSLTGMVGEDLDTLKRKAIELGSTTTQSASQAAEAMAIIGSKRPDLLESAYALSDVTKAAITMSEAASMEVPAAADALAAALNIFQMESSDATRVINVLAAGSKLGAAGIQELGDITFRAGGSAKKAGLSFEEFAGAAEIIRPAFGTAEDAGQAFNKFLQMLESKMDSQYKPSVVGFEQAMRNLKDANLGTTESMKLFTINGVKAYDAIMANVDGLGKMIDGVTGTNTATDQAKTNTDNLAGSMASLSSAWEGFNLALNASNGALKTLVDWLTDAVTWATNTFTELGRIKKKMDEINEAKGNGKQSGIERDLSRLRGSNHKDAANAAIENEYIEEKNKWARAYKAQKKALDDDKVGGDAYLYAKHNLNRILENYKAADNLLKEWRSRAAEVLNPKKQTTETVNNEGGGTGSTEPKSTSSSAVKEIVPKVEVTESLTQLQVLEDQLKTVKNSMKGYGESTDEWKAMNEEVKSLTEQINQLNGKTVEMQVGVSGLSTDAFKSYTTMLQETMKSVDITSPLYNSLQQNLADTSALQNILKSAVQNGIDTISIDAEGLWDKIISGENIPDEAWKGIVDKINEQLDSLNLQPIKLDVETGNLTQLKTTGDETAKAWKGATSAIGSIGSALSSIEDPTAKIAGIVAQALAQLALTFASSLKGTFTPWDWIAASATGTATLISTTAAIKQAVEYHADGGIVGMDKLARGTDTVPAMLTPGEIVLSAANQKTLATALTSDRQVYAPSTPQQSIIKGEDIITIVNRTGRRMGKGEIIFG